MMKRVMATSVALLAAAGTALAQVPAQIPFHGYLTDGQGQPLQRDVSLTLGLYASESGGSPLHTEMQTVTVDHGYFTVFLGDGATLDPAILDGVTSLYVGVAVDSDPEMSPRLRLASVPYALRADSARTLQGFTPEDFAPAGQPVQWADLQGVPADLADGDDGNAFTAGTGITISGTEISLDATGVQAMCLDNESELTALLDDNYLPASYAPTWASVTGTPAGFADGTDDVGPTYTAGTGITISSNQIRINQSTVEGYARGVCLDTEAELTALLDDNYIAAGSQPAWSGITGTPAGFADNVDNEGVTGSGTAGRIPKFTAGTVVGNSIMSEASGTVDVAGNVRAAGQFRYNTARTFTVALSPEVFVPVSATDDDKWGTVNGGGVMAPGTPGMQAPYDMRVAAALHVPGGARLQTLTCFLRDDVGNSADGSLVFRVLQNRMESRSASFLVGQLGSVSSAQSPTDVVSATTDLQGGIASPELSHVVDVQFTVTELEYTVAFKGCRVTYTVEELTP